MSKDYVSTTLMDAANKQIEKTKKERIVFSQNSCIEKIVLSKPTLKSLVVVNEGEIPTGKVAQPVRALENFKKIFGVDTSTNPVTFKYCDKYDIDNARKIYDILVEANAAAEAEGKIESPNVEINDGMSEPRIVGVLLRENTGVVQYQTMSSLKTILMEKSIGVIPTVNDMGQFRIGKNERMNKANEENGSGSVSSYDEVVAIKIANRKQLLGDTTMVEYVSRVDKSKPAEMKGGLKSKLSARYAVKNEDSRKEAIYRTYRISLSCLQYATVTDHTRFNNVFK